MGQMLQEAPYPEPLRLLVARLRYRPGWRFTLTDLARGQGSKGLTLVITTRGYDSYHPERGENYQVNHYMPVPPAAFDERSWRRWLFEQILLVERHEAMEFFRFEWDQPSKIVSRADGSVMPGNAHHVDRPYAPSHGPGNDPYLIREVGTDADRRTSFRGELLPP